MRVRPLAYFAPVLGLAACTIAEPGIGVTEQGLRCDPDFCSTNSPVIGWEFNLHGRRNHQGLSLIGFGLGNEFLDLGVANSHVTGRDKSGRVYENSALAGATMYFVRGSTQYALVINDVAQINELVKPNGKLDTYLLGWANVIDNPLPYPMHAGDTLEGGNNGNMPVLDTPTPACAPEKWYPEDPRSDWGEWDESAAGGLSPYQALIFEGDRFDPELRTVQTAPNDDWFNVACGTTTPAKLRLTRNTIHTAPAWQNVQAAMKMLGADYCGGGMSFTQPGEHLVWRDRTAMNYLHIHPTSSLEARWDENGAICIYDPRLVRSSNPIAPGIYPGVWTDIENECNAQGKVLDKCLDADPLTWDGELVTSANYD